MFKLNEEDLLYEKYIRLLEDGEDMQQDPNMQQQDPQTPEEFYQQGLDDIQRTIAETGRKRYQKYKLDGGKDNYKMFKKNMEDQLKQELDDDTRAQFGGIPGQETEKELLGQIKNILYDIKGNLDTSLQQDQEAMQNMDPNAQQDDPNIQQQDPNMQVQQDPNAQQQIQQESFDFIDRERYKNRMNNLFDYYFN